MTLDAAAMLAAYDAQLRGEPELSGDLSQRVGPLVLRQVSPERGFLTYRDLGGATGDRVDALIDEATAWFRDQTSVEHFEWKTRGHDLPADLPERLAAHGFEPEETESVMLGPVDGVVAAATGLPDGVAVRRVADDDAETFHRAHEMQAHVFGGRFGTAEESRERCARSQGLRSLWVAEADAEAAQDQPWGPVVCAGVVDVVPGTEFAGVWGGATLAHWRGRGIYRALTAGRAAAARDLGARWVQSDSTEFSRPILERSGLVRVTTTTPWIWHRGA